MFGMLDYRAHNLLWLYGMPLRLLSWVLYFALIAGAIAIAQWTGYALLLQILIGYIAYEVLAMLAQVVLLVLGWVAQRVFFFVVDVVPARGETVEEAKQIALHGDIVWLSNKFDKHIENWTVEDTDKMASVLNWRARWFLNARERLEDRVDVMKAQYAETGRRPAEMSQDEIKALIGHLEDWREWVVVRFFQSIVAFVIILSLIHI